MGDSMTEGACVKKNENIASFMRSYGFNAISLGG